jgi:PHD/YefM family antitoxin component YafN of YafNO toxin-antitoxin module
MVHTSLEQISGDLPATLYRAIETSEEVSIATPKGAVIVISQEEYDSMQETLRLLSDKRALGALLEGHRQRDAGERPAGYSISEAFGEL